MRKYIPNTLTLLRLIIVPFLGYFIYCEKYTTAIILFAIGGFTDVLDGYIARKYNLVTKWGKVFDPLADKLMQITALVFLVLHKFIPLVVLVIVLIKESLMLIGGIMVYKKGRTVIGANWYGKLATVIFYFAILSTIILKNVAGDSGYASTAIYVAIGLAVLCTLFALAMYISIYFKFSKDYSKKNNK